MCLFKTKVKVFLACVDYGDLVGENSGDFFKNWKWKEGGGGFEMTPPSSAPAVKHVLYYSYQCFASGWEENNEIKLW